MIRPLIAFTVVALLASFAFAQVTPEQQQKIDENVPAKPTYKVAKPHKVLIWSRAVGFKHKSIPHGGYAMKKMGAKSGVFDAVETSDLAMLLPESLKNYDGLILNNTTGRWIRPDTMKYADDKALIDKFGDADKAEQALRKSVMDFVSGGGALIGYHSASDANYEWPEFGRMIGGYFNHHPWGANDTVTVHIDEPKHPLMKAFGGKNRFDITDEIYQFKEPYSRENQRVLLSLDTSESGKTDMTKKNIQRTDGDFGVAWVRTQGKGRVFYSSLGHREEIFWNPMIMQFYLDGIQWALGDTDVPADPRPRKVAAAAFESDVCAHCAKAEKAKNAAKGEKAEWIDLVDLSKWDFKPGAWTIEDGVLTLKDVGKNNIWTKQPHGDFVLELEVKVSEKCNSGVFFRADPANPVQGGFEIQIFDSHGKAEVTKHDSGALYDAVPPAKNAMKPAGEWNTFRLRAKGPKITVTLNDEKAVTADLDEWKTPQQNPDGSKNKFKTALKDLPRTGHIGFQDHGQAVWYRNIRIKALD